MKLIFAIGAGSFIGGIGRYLLSMLIHQKIFTSFPFGTFIVNVLGCFLIGIVYGFSIKGSISNDWRLFLATGVLGGFTTFSAFSYESISLFKTGNTYYALLYICLSVIVGLLATFTALSIVKVY